MNKKPLVSILTPTYNMGKYLDECIQSVLKQDYPNIEHIIQDANSEDNSVNILRKYSNRRYKTKIKIYREPDKGQSDGLNKALLRSSGEIILVLNSDDALIPDACSWAVSNFQKFKDIGVLYGDQYLINEKSEIVGLHIQDKFNLEKLICIELIPPAQAAFIKRSALKKVGFWVDKDLDTCPDFEMWIRITRMYSMKHIYKAIAKYRVFEGIRFDSKQLRTVQRFVASKRKVLNRLFNDPTTPRKIKRLRLKAYAGLDIWASHEAFAMKMPDLAMFYLIRSLIYNPKKTTFLRIIYNLRRFFNTLILKLSKLVGIYKQVIMIQSAINNFINKTTKFVALTLKISFENVPLKKVQDFWDSYPCNINHSSSSKFTKKYFDEVEKRKYFVEPHIPKFAQFSRWKGKKVLEIGCGIGTDTINFARAGAKVTTVEISKSSLEIARKRARIYGLEKKIKFYLGNAEELSSFVPIKPYDLIYSFGVIHHTPYPHKVMLEVKKYLHDNTIIKIMVYHRMSWKVFWMLIKYSKGAFWKLGKTISRYSEAAIGSPVSYTYTKSSVRELLRGFDIIQLETDHIFPYDISSYRRYRYKKVWYFRFLSQNAFHWLEKHIGWHLLITATKKHEAVVIPVNKI